MQTEAVRTVLARSRWMDWLIMASLLLLAWFEIWVEPIFQTGMPGPQLPLTVLAMVTLTPLLARRVFPLGAITVMCLGYLGIGVVGDPEQSTFPLILGVLVGAYSLAAYGTPRNALLGAAVIFVTGVVLSSITFAQQTLVDALVPGLFVAGAWIIGKEVHRQRQRASELADRTALLARTHQLEMAAAVTTERTRIARELHDVVAHAISVMGIQAGAARRTLAPGQMAQREALLDVERLGREALTEMQRMLGVLRTGEDEQAADPLPNITGISALAEDARRAGVEVEVDVAGEPERLPAGLQLTAYRIVQEALTNVRKHARASRVDLTIARYGEHLEVSIADDGEGVTGVPEPGNGLIGMRERVAMHHGTLYAGPGEGQGFLVRVRLPVPVEP
jgi:signal transduction histidine kinase